MTTDSVAWQRQRQPELLKQTVVVALRLTSTAMRPHGEDSGQPWTTDFPILA
jgi:hypothetical protein